MLRAIEDQWVQRQIQDVAYDRQQETESGERIVVGVNKFEIEERQEMDLEEVTEEDERRQIDQLNSVREERDDAAVEAKLDTLRETAQGDGNLLPPMIEAVKVYATVGEVCDVLRDEFGEYRGAGAV